MIWLIAVLCVAIVMVLSAIVVVLVAGNQSGTADIKVKYTAIDVAVTISANCYIGSETYAFNTAKDGSGVNSISLNPDGELSGVLYQPNSEDGLALSMENNRVVFEYIFQNDTSNINDKGIDINITLPRLPGLKDGVEVEGEREGVNVGYAVSDTKVTDFSDLVLEDTYGDANGIVLLSAGSEVGQTKYIYVVVSIADPLYNALFKGGFEWTLTRANIIE